MKFYTYILFSKQLDRYYIGSTNAIEDRLERHLANKSGFTSKAKDWKLKYFEEYSMRSEAVQREMKIKKWKSRKMIEKLIGV